MRPIRSSARARELARRRWEKSAERAREAMLMAAKSERELWWHTCPSDGVWKALSVSVQPECERCGESLRKKTFWRRWLRQLARRILKTI